MSNTLDLQEEDNPFKPGTLAHGLWVATRAMRPATPRPKRSPSATPRKKIVAVRCAKGGDSNPQKASKRRAILDWIAMQHDGTATIAALEAHFNEPVRGHVQKLIEKKHLEVVQ
jgi:hypothetical protein